MAKQKDDAATVEITQVEMKEMDVFILGCTPFMNNRLSEKARRELLMPKGRKNAAERASSLKHEPLQEFRASVYRDVTPGAATRIFYPGAAFRRAVATAALDIPGATKAQVGRLVRVKEYNVSVFGTPRISAMIVRQAGIQRTPDVRIRAILPEWACKLTLAFSHPVLKDRTVLNLLAAAGDWVGVGDGRNEKGALSFGCFRICGADDPDWLRIVKEGGRQAQDAALQTPVAYDLETEELLAWFDTESQTRGFRDNGGADAKPKSKKGSPNTESPKKEKVKL